MVTDHEARAPLGEIAVVGRLDLRRRERRSPHANVVELAKEVRVLQVRIAEWMHAWMEQIKRIVSKAIVGRQRARWSGRAHLHV